jgi:hypothetical protein
MVSVGSDDSCCGLDLIVQILNSWVFEIAADVTYLKVGSYGDTTGIAVAGC